MERSPKMQGRKEEIRRIREFVEQGGKGGCVTVLIEGERGLGKTTVLDKVLSESQGFEIIRINFFPDRKNIPLSGFLSIDGIREAIFSDKEAFFGEVFLINNYGILIAHESNIESEMDEDILGSMLTAVQEFVKDSFGGEGGLGKLEYGDKKILIEHGKTAFMAAVISGDEHPKMRVDMIKTIEEIEKNMGDIFLEWDGDVEKISDVIPFLKKLTSKRYLIKTSAEDAELERERIKVLEKVLRVIESHSTPRIIAVEDIHWADELSLLSLAYLSRNLESSVVIGTLRREDMDKKSMEILESMGAERIVLNPLDRDDLRMMVEDMFSPSDFSEGFLEKIFEQSGGNPFYVQEMLFSLVEEGIIYSEEGIWKNSKDEISVPKTVSELISWRLDRLSRNELSLVEMMAASVSSNMEVIGKAMGLSEKILESLVENLMERGILKKQGAEVVFFHSGVREVAYEEMSQRWRLVTHKSLGETIEELEGPEGDAVYQLAYHFSRSLERDKGIRYSCMAGERATASYAAHEAMGYYEVALSIIEGYMPKHGLKNEVLERLGELYSHTGQYERALRAFENLLPICDSPRRIYRKMAEIYRKTGRYEDALNECEKGLEADGDDMEIGRIMGVMGAIYLRKGEMETAMKCYMKYLKISEDSGNLVEESNAYRALGGAYFHGRNTEKAIETWKKSMEMARKAGDSLRETYALINLGVAYRSTGDLEKAREFQEKALEVAKKTEDIYAQAQILNNLGTVYYMLGDMEKQIDAWEESLRIKKRIGDRLGAANIYNNLGMAYYEAGHFDISARYLEKGLELFEMLGDVRGLAKVLCNLVLPYSVLGDGRIEDIVDRASELIEKKSLEELVPNLLRSRVAYAAYKGNPDEAMKEYRKNLPDIMEKYGDIEQWIGAKLDISRFLMRWGKVEEAKKELDDVIESSEKHGMTRYRTIALNMIENLGK